MNIAKHSAKVTEVNFTKIYPGFTLACDFKTNYLRTAIFGPSGSGKSTLLNCLSGFSTPDKGSIQINGSQVFSSTNNINVPPDKRRLGYIMQNPSLFPHMNVKQNIYYALNLTPLDLRRFDIEKIIHILEIETLLDKNINSISGGQAQRVALARTLATSPSLLLLDEPWTGLEKRLVSTIINYIKTISSEFNLPLFFVSHDIEDVHKIANQVVVLNKGKISSIIDPMSLLMKNQSGEKHAQPNIINKINVKVKSPITSSNSSLLSTGQIEILCSPLNLNSGDEATVILNSKDIILCKGEIGDLAVENMIPVTIDDINHDKNTTLIKTNLDGQPLSIDIPKYTANTLTLHKGLEIYLAIKSSNINLLI